MFREKSRECAEQDRNWRECEEVYKDEGRFIVAVVNEVTE